MNNRVSNLGQMFKWLSILIILIVVIAGGIFTYIYFSKGSVTKQTIKTNIDKITIVNKIQSQNRLETIKQTLQRDIEIELDLGDVKFFDIKLLENKRKQKFAVTGSVSAGIDLAKLNANNIKPENEKLIVDLPASEVFSVNIIEDKTTLLKDDLTLLFRIQDNLDNTKRRELNDLLLKQAIKQSKQALVGAACENKILDQAATNGKQSVKDILKSSNYQNIEVNAQPGVQCKYSDFE